MANRNQEKLDRLLKKISEQAREAEAQAEKVWPVGLPITWQHHGNRQDGVVVRHVSHGSDICMYCSNDKTGRTVRVRYSPLVGGLYA